MKNQELDDGGEPNPEFATRSRNKPAVCFVVAEQIDSLATAVLRAYRHGHYVFIAPLTNVQGEVVELARQLDASVINPDTLDPDTPLRQHMVNVARGEGFPGLIYQESPRETIDYDRTEVRFNETTRYCVSPVTGAEESELASVIAGIPAYNEETSIGSIVISAQQHSNEVIVVDDGSDDRTGEVAEQAGATVLQHAKNKGKGAALQTLLNHVRDREFDVLVLLDGDGQHAPADIPRVIRPVVDERADLAIGSRYVDQSQDDETPHYRRVGQQMLDLLTFGTSRTRVSDSQSGFRALSPEAVESLSINATSYGVESEMIDSLARQDLSIVERPIEVRYDGIDGQTHNPLRHGLEVVTFILHLVRDRHPLLFFAFPGLVITLAGMGYGINTILIHQSTGTFYPIKTFISGFLTIIGVLGVFTGFVLNRIHNSIRKFQQQVKDRQQPTQSS